MTAAEISRIAGVTRATVSNWRRRHDDFPAPSGGTETSPLYDLPAVQAWLRGRGHTSTASPAEELRTALRLLGPGSGVAARLFPLVAAASRRTPEELSELAAVPDDQLIARAEKAAAQLPAAVPEAEPVRYGPNDAGAVRALLGCVREAGAQAAVDVLAERELDEGAASGVYQTPEGLALLMARLLPAGAARVLDPACGSGTLLTAAARQGAQELFGQDSLPVQVQRTAVRLLLAEPEAETAIRVGDSLRADAFPDVTVDAVLCNPPFGDRDWGHDELAYDPRWAYGLPPRFESELAWVQHALAHLEPGGHAVMLLPPALAFRSSGRRIRGELIRSGALRAVVSLPARAAYPLHIGLHVWVFQRPEPGGTDRTTVLFVDGEGEQRDGATGTQSSTDTATAGAGTRGGSRPRRSGSSSSAASSAPAPSASAASFDWAGLTDRVLDQWAAFTTAPDTYADEPGVARAVPLVDLLDDVVDVTPARHVRATAADIDPAALAGRVHDLHGRLAEQVAALAAACASGEWQPSGASAREWRTATVSDLARGGALTVVRAATPGTRGSKGPAAPTLDRPVLTAQDISAGNPPSSGAFDIHPDAAQPVAAGDVLMRAVAGGGDAAAMTRVADDQDAGALLGPHIHLLRPDPARLDPWFLAGFLGAEDNIASASTGSTHVHVTPGRLRVPLLPLEEQRRYGEAFRRVYKLRAAVRQTADLAADTAATLTTGLTAGVLLPPDTPDSRSA
ncbi:N-6 DNA methylase [Streptomyces sp. NBC_01762]|uniref:N-6 DNA methylase n=1 Tax=unclassified Streptomyces TaxID=2593676 RepID=UPI002DDAE60C|nr:MULTISPECIES: N-6 DNA methylase [unclassified Streptomyces]WSC46476.1 N-6 DNA methylase [Streptomyces sp. NBC_01762]WSD26128.1 N-6 DNA methylase [Streptomyces sp. NBC_01751]